MSAGHDHDHSPPADFSGAFAIGIALNLAFVAVEAFYGFLADSMTTIATTRLSIVTIIITEARADVRHPSRMLGDRRALRRWQAA